MPIYTDIGVEYPELAQPKSEYVRLAEDEFGDDEKVTWPQVQARAWELQELDENRPPG
jgi:hypothetical protein